MQPFSLYIAPSGPNPWKVVIILNELSLPHELVDVPYTDLKKPEYTKLNPNGRVPALRDPNNGDFLIWETGAIIQYLVDQYDKDGKISYKTFPNKEYLNQYMFFQASGQGPYYGQAAWFAMFNPEKIPAVQERYFTEVRRVTAVLDEILARNGTGWLVGDKCTYADLSFVMWDKMAHEFMGDAFKLSEYPHFAKWHQSLLQRPSVVKAVEKRAELVAAMAPK